MILNEDLYKLSPDDIGGAIFNSTVPIGVFSLVVILEKYLNI